MDGTNLELVEDFIGGIWSEGRDRTYIPDRAITELRLALMRKSG